MYVACVFSRSTLKLFFHTQLENHDHDAHTQHESELLLVMARGNYTWKSVLREVSILMTCFLTMVQSF